MQGHGFGRISLVSQLDRFLTEIGKSGSLAHEGTAKQPSSRISARERYAMLISLSKVCDLGWLDPRLYKLTQTGVNCSAGHEVASSHHQERGE